MFKKLRYILSGEVHKQHHSKNYNKVKYHQFVHFSPNIRFPALQKQVRKNKISGLNKQVKNLSITKAVAVSVNTIKFKCY